MRVPWVAVVAASTLLAAEPRTVADLHGAHARQRLIIGAVNEEDFDKMALEFLGSEAVTLGKFAVYASVQDRVAAGPRGFDHCAYGPWRAVAEKYAQSHTGCPVVKEAVKIGGNILVRSVGADCHLRQRILKGRADPLRLEIDAESVELLEIDLGPLTRAAHDDRIAWHAYARTRAPITAELAKTLASYLIRLSGEDAVGVDLRPDAWFVTQCGFPAVYPFEDRGALPSLDQLASVSSAGCSNFTTTGRLQCSATSRPR